MQVRTSRPTSVTGLAVLAIVLGALSILTGIAGVGLGVLVVGDYSSLAATILLTLGTVIVVFGMLEIVYGVGFLQGNGWSWTLGMVIAMVSLVSSIAAIIVPTIAPPIDSIALGVLIISAEIAIIPITTSSVTIVVLTRPRVKAFFGKSPATTKSPTKSMEVN